MKGISVIRLPYQGSGG